MMPSVMSVVRSCGLLLVLLLVSLRDLPTVTAQQDNDVCNTQPCQDASRKMRSYMNTSVQACDNFYEYACGGWVEMNKNNKLLKEAGYVSQLLIMDKRVNKIANDIITATDGTGSQPPIFQKPRIFYSTCMDNCSIEEAGKQPLLTLLDSLGGWPMIDDAWIADRFDLTTTMANLFMFGRGHLFYFCPWNDLNNASVMALFVTQPFEYGIGSRESYFSNKTEAKLAAYRSTILTVVQKLKGSAANEQDVDDMMAFEGELVNISRSWDVINKEDVSLRNNRYTVATMETNFPVVRWSAFFDKLFERHEVDIAIHDDELVINYNPNYFTRLQQLLERTDKKVIANFLMWRTAKNMLPYLSHEYQMIDLNLKKVLKGQEALSDRADQCAKASRNEFGKVLGNTYVTQYVANTTKEQVELMVDDLKKAFNEQVNKCDWMDAETKENALDKNDMMRKVVAYSDDILKMDYLNKYYEYVSMVEGKYFENRVSLKREAANRAFKELRKIQDKRKYEVEPMVVNAQHVPTKNVIGIFAGILLSPMFNAENPKYMNYGGIGMVIGHEITHGFDSRGRGFDKFGNAVNWWTNNSKAAFDERTDCFINQFNAFVSPEAGSNVKGLKTLPENIADSGGVGQSYRAYKNWVREHNNGLEEKPLPEMGLTVDQLFFLSYAQTLCGKYNPKKAQHLIDNDVHAPNRFRVIGPLQNSEDFARAFSCPTGSNMNPENKCVIW